MTDIQKIINDDKLINEKAKEAIAALDKNGDGSIDIHELKGFIDEICKEAGLPKGPSDAEVKEIFDEIDTDKSGKITVDEMASLLKKILMAFA